MWADIILQQPQHQPMAEFGRCRASRLFRSFGCSQVHTRARKFRIGSGSYHNMEDFQPSMIALDACQRGAPKLPRGSVSLSRLSNLGNMGLRVTFLGHPGIAVQQQIHVQVRVTEFQKTHFIERGCTLSDHMPISRAMGTMRLNRRERNNRMPSDCVLVAF